MSSFANVTAKSWIVADSQGNILSGENTNEVRSIASITKLMTVMVFLDAVPEPSKHEQELIQQAIVSSNNKAAKHLCEIHPDGYYDCILLMNMKATELGLKNTHFFEPTGLSVFNVSTANDLVKIVKEASKYPLITKASKTKKHNTNPTINKYDYTVSKTGFINMAGGCIVAMVNDKIVVLLGSKSVRTRIPEMEKLIALHKVDSNQNDNYTYSKKHTNQKSSTKYTKT